MFDCLIISSECRPSKMADHLVCFPAQIAYKLVYTLAVIFRVKYDHTQESPYYSA